MFYAIVSCAVGVSCALGTAPFKSAQGYHSQAACHSAVNTVRGFLGIQLHGVVVRCEPAGGKKHE